MKARRQLNPNSESVDNYLKAILVLGGSEENRVTGNALAHRLDVAPASVTESWSLDGALRRALAVTKAGLRGQDGKVYVYRGGKRYSLSLR